MAIRLCRRDGIAGRIAFPDLNRIAARVAFPDLNRTSYVALPDLDIAVGDNILDYGHFRLDLT